MVRLREVTVLAVLGPGIAAAQITNVRVLGTTPTQAVIAYVASTSQACKFEASKQPGYTPLAIDVDPALFPGEDQDSRSGSLTLGRTRTFVAGKPRVERAGSGAKYSRALQADSDYYFRVTCGADVATGKFRTLNPPLGSTHMDGLESDPNNPGAYLWPSNNESLFPEIVDPKTGVLAKNIDTSGWSYGSGSGAAGVAFSDVQDPSGHWTNPSFALATDTNWAAYPGNAQEWLWFRLNFYPDNSTFTQNELSYQNIILEGMCAGTACGTGGELVDVCITRLGIDEKGAHCENPIRTVALANVMSPIRICGDGALCQQPSKPGDIMLFDRLPKFDSVVGDGYVYNTSADYTKIFFGSLNDCRRLWPGETVLMYVSPSAVTFSVTLSSLNCGANPPQAVMSSSVIMDYNGTTGIPFYYFTGMANPRYGILVRKSSATASSTIYINSAKWVGASALNTTFANGSGGFNRVCTKRTDANGFYHCHAGNNMITGIRTEPDGNITVRFLGMAWLFGQGYGLQSGFQTYGPAANDFLWDDTNPNVMYFASRGYADNSGTQLVKATYTGNDLVCGTAGSACPPPDPYGSETQRWPQLPATFQILTPCLNGCLNPADDYSLEKQFARYTASKSTVYIQGSFPNCALEAVAGSTLLAACRQGQQDSFAWVFALDLGNGLPIGAGFVGRFGNTQQVFAANPIFARGLSKWCTLHTYQNVHKEGISTPEFQIEKIEPFKVTQTGSLPACSKLGGANCDLCPSVVVNGTDYTGKNFCGTLNTTTSWNGAWGAVPAGFATGEPVSTLANLHWMQPLGVGDELTSAGEVIRVIQKNGPSQYIVERGVGFDQSYQFPRAQGNGSVWPTGCEFSGAHWFYELDPDGTGTTSTYFPTDFVNHAFGRDGVRVHPDYAVSLSPFTPSQMQDLSYFSLIVMPDTYAQKQSFASGNTIEKHPSYGQEDAPAYDQGWFVDGHPYLFAGNSGSTQFSAVKISGDLYRYRYAGTIDAKQYDLAAFAGANVLREVSGPGSVVTGTSADAYKACRALVNNECTSGSTAGDVYMNIPVLDLTVNYCKEGEFFSGWRDICAVNFNVLGGSYAQWALPHTGGLTVRNFLGGRVLTRLFEPFRGSSTSNTKPTPDGQWIMLRSNIVLKLPPYPAANSVVRTSFSPVVVNLKPPASAGVNNAVVEFGYTTTLYCTVRTEKCVATKSAIDEVNPFVWPTEVGGDTGVTGMPCSSGCTIAIPAISGKVVFYRWSYRNASQAVIATSPLQVTVVP